MKRGRIATFSFENAYNSMGLAYKRLRKWDQAIRFFNEELKCHPENIYAHVYLGESYEALKNYPMAMTHYKKALGNPDLPETERIRKAVLTIESGQKQRKED